MKNKPTIGIVGAGKLGTTLAQLALKAGYTVYISGSGDPGKIKLTIDVLTPGAKAATTQEVAIKSDVIILALPLSKYTSLPKHLFAGKLVIDAMNYWWEVDGHDERLKNPPKSSSEMVQDFLSEARVVKALSHMGYHHLFDEAAAARAPDRKAIAIAGNNQADVATVSNIVDDFGFDPLVIGGLEKGKKIEPGTPAFGANISLKDLAKSVD